MRRVRTANQLKLAFDSLPELSRFIRDTPRVWSKRDSETAEARLAWDLSLSYASAVEYATQGWLEGAAQAARAIRILPLRSPAPDTRTDFYGHMPHVPRYCAGAPDSMIRRARDASSGGGKVLTLYVPINALGGVGAEAMRNLGLAVAQYVNQLETDGHRVELHGATCTDFSGGVRGTTTWRIKSADQPLDLAVMSFAIGHPAMFRRLGFAIYERSGVPVTPGYGRTATMTLGNVIDPPAGAYVFNGVRMADKVAGTPEAALEYVTNQLDAMLGVADAREAA